MVLTKKSRKRYKEFLERHPVARKIIGSILIVIGLISVVTPFTPLGFLLIVGLEIFGFRFLFWEKFKDRHRK